MWCPSAGRDGFVSGVHRFTAKRVIGWRVCRHRPDRMFLYEAMGISVEDISDGARVGT